MPTVSTHTHARTATPHVSAHLVIEFVLKVLNKRNPYLLENFAGEVMQVTLKFLLRFRPYYSEMTTENWRDLLKICVWLYEKNIPNADPQSIVGIMAGVVRLCHTREAAQCPPIRLEVLHILPAFLRRALLSERLGKQFSLHSSLLKLLLAFTSTMACEWRQLLCRLGEDTFDSVLAMWDDRPSPKQTRWLEYVCLLVTLHHPQLDGEVPEESQYAGDPQRWHRCMRHLYQLLHDHLMRRTTWSLTESVGSGSSGSGGGGGGGGGGVVVLSEPLLSLVVRVSLQVFSGSDTTGFINVTQISSTASTSRDSGGGGGKRRKIEVGLVPLADRLRTEGTLPHLLPWYQVLLSLLSEHKCFFTEPKCVLLLEALTQVLSTGCSDTVVQDMVLRCLSALAIQYSAVVVVPREGDRDEHSGANSWAPVWDMTLRLVSGRQSSGPGLTLMGTLIATKLILPESSAFELFHQNYLEANEEALWALLAALTSVPLPRHLDNEPAWLRTTQVQDARKTLIQYALPIRQLGSAVGGVGSRGAGGGVLGCLRNPPLLAKVLACLCLREPHTSKQVNLHHLKKHHQHHHHHHHHTTTTTTTTSLITKLEEILHLSSFTCDLPAAKVIQASSDDPQTPTEGGGGGGGGGSREECSLPGEWEFVIQRVCSFTDQVATEDSQGSAEGVEALIHLAELHTLLYASTQDNRLKDKFRHTMRLVTASLEKMCSEGDVSRWATLHPLLACLLHLFRAPEEEEEEEEEEVVKASPPPPSPPQPQPSTAPHRQLLSCTPPGLFAVVLSLLEKRSERVTAAAANSTQLLRGNSMNQASVDDFDLDFDDTLPSTAEAMREEILEFEEEASNQGEEGQQGEENIIIDNPATLSQRDRCVVLAGRWLVHASAATTAVATTPAGTPEHTFLHKGVDVVLQLSSAPGIEMGDVAVVLSFVRSLFVAEYSEDNVLDGLEVISNVAKVHGGQTQVARCSLNSLAELVRRHGPQLSPDARTSLLTLTKAFATKLHQGSYGGSVTKAIFRVNVELTKVDPLRQWSRYDIPNYKRCCRIYGLLGNANHEVRVRAATATHLLLLARHTHHQRAEQLNAQHQDRMFEEVYQMVLEALNVEDLPKEELAPDERGNRVTSFLLALGTVALSSPFLEGKALFALCLSVPVYKLETTQLLQLLSCITKSKGTSPKALLNTNLPYLATQWVQHGYDITAFPSAAFGYPTMNAFLTENRNALLPVLLECDQRTAIDTLAEACGKGVRDLYSEAFPLLMARIFPYIAAEQATALDGCQPTEAKIQGGKRQYKQVERTLGTDAFTALLTAHIGEVTLHLLRLVHEPRPWVEGEVVVQPPPPTFHPSVIHATLTFVGEIFRQDGLLLAFLAGRRQELHKVVEGVVEGLAGGTAPHTARSALAAAAVLLEAVLPHLSTHLAQASHYLVRMLLHLLTCCLARLWRLGHHLAHRCTDLLHQLLVAALQHLPSHLPPAVPTLFGRLLPLVAQPGVAPLLQLLLDSNHPEVQAALARLPAPPLHPDSPALASLRQAHQRVVAVCRGRPDLLDEVDNFLAVPAGDVATHHLTHLAAMVRGARGQVPELYAGAGPSQESRGHRLAHRLVALAAGGAEGTGEVAMEACQCLGELGPLSLGTPVFLTGEGSPDQPQDEGEADEGYVRRILLALNACLTCGTVEVERAAAQALVGVLATRDGHEAFQGLPSPTVQELRPLLPDARPKPRAAAGSSGSGGMDAEAYIQIVGQEEVWVGGAGYEAWVCGLAAALVTAGCGSEVAAPLLPVCALRPAFSALVLPFLVHAALTTDTGGRRDVLSKQVAAFFARHGQEGGPAAAPASHDKAAIQALLAVVDHLRLYCPTAPLTRGGQARRGTTTTTTSTPFDNNLCLQLNYLDVARAAHYCGAHFSALLYLQLHHQQLLQQTPPERGAAAITHRLQAPPMARVAAHPEAEAAGRLLLAVHEALGDGAGVEGCLAAGALAPDAPAARLLHCRHRGEWLAGLAVCDAAHHRAGLLEGLAALGLYNTVAGVLASEPHTQHTAQAQWQAAWRLCRWEDIGEGRQQGGGVAGSSGGGGGAGEEGGAFHQHLCEALRALHHHDTHALTQHTRHARTAITHTLATIHAESTSLIYPILTQLQVLDEVEEVARCLSDLTNAGEANQCIHDLQELWAAKDSMGSVEYRYKEEVLAVRISSLKALTSVSKNEEIQALLHTTLLAKSRLGRTEAREGNRASHSLVGSEAAVLWASQLAVTPALTHLTRLEEAEVARAGGDVQRARHILQTLLGQMEGRQGQEQVLSQVLTLMGELLMGARSLPPHTIIREYFTRATTTLLSGARDKDSRDVLENSHQRLAQYVEQLYRQAHNTLESEASQAKRVNIQRSQEELGKLNNLIKGCKENSADWKELMKKIVLLQRNVNIDCEFLRDLEREKEQYLGIALEAYLSCLAITSEHHLNTYRLAALWLHNSDQDDVNKKISELGVKVKSHHFVPLLYQLVARLSTHNSHQATSFPAVLFQLLVRVCEEHPHHGLPVIFALAHAHADDHLLAAGKRKAAAAAAAVTEEDRVQAAKMLVERLKKASIKEHVVEFERVCLAYLSLANWCGSLGRLNSGDKVAIPNTQPIQTLKQLSHTTALTHPLKLQPSAQYSPPLIQDWEGTGMFVGGINAPVRLSVLTSDGTKHLELLKGKDDVRQDAVMEQVFGIVNELLTRSAETRDCGLSVRTYQVVPLSQRSGLIQWCRNTQAFGRYLIGADKKSGAHKVYYPSDYTSRACVDKMKAAKAKSAEEKLRVFQDILEHFHPVFHHFFLEQYPSPHQWFQRRQAYTRSVATNSMVGYVLGLGDRHTENILLDKTTAELVHIDLGIAFELGKVLPTPETVPFRMTQDIVAGLGVLGVEGPLRCWCEATMRVLRGGGEVLVTLVEVLRHDPLHQWTLTPQQVSKLQATGEDEEGVGSSQNTVSMAERVVLTVRQKLVGMEEGFPCTVPDQVNRLLQEATNPANLCRLFPGWQPYV